MLLLSLQYYECYNIIDTYRVRGRVPIFTPLYTYDTRIVTVVNYSSLAGRRRPQVVSNRRRRWMRKIKFFF